MSWSRLARRALTGLGAGLGAGLAAGVLAATLAAAPAPAPAAATAPASADTPAPGTVTCRYVLISTWPSGFTADIFITNHGPAIDGWAVHWTFDTATTVTTVWSGRIHQADPHDATGVPAFWNRVIGTGQTTAFGWNALATVTEVPTDLTINGVPC